MWYMGDFDGDNVVGPADASIVASNWGYGVTSEATAAVPEPQAFAMIPLGLTLAAYALRLRKRGPS